MTDQNTPAITATVHAYVEKRLAEGILPDMVRGMTLKAFVEPFAEGSPDKKFVEPYRQQIAAAIDKAIHNYRSMH